MSAIVSPLKKAAKQAAATAIQTTGAADRSGWLCNFAVQVVALCQLALCCCHCCQMLRVAATVVICYVS
jgi:hypothetical protein